MEILGVVMIVALCIFVLFLVVSDFALKAAPIWILLFVLFSSAWCVIALGLITGIIA